MNSSLTSGFRLTVTLSQRAAAHGRSEKPTPAGTTLSTIATYSMLQTQLPEHVKRAILEDRWRMTQIIVRTGIVLFHTLPFMYSRETRVLPQVRTTPRMPRMYIQKKRRSSLYPIFCCCFKTIIHHGFESRHETETRAHTCLINSTVMMPSPL